MNIGEIMDNQNMQFDDEIELSELFKILKQNSRKKYIFKFFLWC